MKLFGRELFGYKKEPGMLYDFAQHGIVANRTNMGGPESIEMMITNTVKESLDKKPKKKKAVVKPAEPSAKEVYAAGGLNSKSFVIKNGEDYIQEQVSIIDSKLNFIGPKPKQRGRRGMDETFAVPEWGPVSYGRMELESIRERLLARAHLSEKEVADVVAKYPHTTSQLVSDLLTAQRHLRCARSDSFVPDFPKDAIQAMEEYNKLSIKVTGKKTTFYVIAKHEDFEQIQKRRDPILLAESPFGHFWQVLGAWDEEMVFLGDL
jgi:hypothetical protein